MNEYVSDCKLSSSSSGLQGIKWQRVCHVQKLNYTMFWKRYYCFLWWMFNNKLMKSFTTPGLKKAPGSFSRFSNYCRSNFKHCTFIFFLSFSSFFYIKSSLFNDEWERYKQTMVSNWHNVIWPSSVCCNFYVALAFMSFRLMKGRVTLCRQETIAVNFCIWRFFLFFFFTNFLFIIIEKANLFLNFV